LSALAQQFVDLLADCFYLVGLHAREFNELTMLGVFKPSLLHRVFGHAQRVIQLRFKQPLVVQKIGGIIKEPGVLGSDLHQLFTQGQDLRVQRRKFLPKGLFDTLKLFLNANTKDNL
jgi:hypothetical protein